jgi:hypothetical protein
MVHAINSARPRTPNNSHECDKFNDPYVPWEERWETGKRLRERVPREKHAGWAPPKDRPDPIDLLIKSNSTRMPELVPIRHARLPTSSFACDPKQLEKRDAAA